MENFVKKFNKIKIDDSKKCLNVFNDTNCISDKLLNYNSKPKKGNLNILQILKRLVKVKVNVKRKRKSHLFIISIN